MQETYEITVEDMLKAHKEGYSVMVIINGEWYELKDEKESKSHKRDRKE